jgi:hypothetical protein
MRIRAPLVVEGEWNVVLNPKHPQFALVQIADPKPLGCGEGSQAQRHRLCAQDAVRYSPLAIQ